MKHVSVTEANERRVEVTLLDCREALELDIAAIEGALHIPMGEIPGRMDDIPRDREVIVFCHTGVRSQSVTQFLNQHGYDNVANMTGGIDAWSLDVDPGTPRY